MNRRCPVSGFVCSTAYRKGCRCDACRGNQRAYDRRYRAANRKKDHERKHFYRAANAEKVREYSRGYRRRRRSADPEKARAECREYSQRLRAALVAFLGGSCQRCGSLKRLDAHHRNGDGAEHRKRAGGVQSSYLEILSGSYPREAVELLCRSCHNRETMRAP